ncbi:MAG: endonuclease [Candidatus Eremiobacteraeota bacterium]|nr:endonuclease [Candidatus Eremiobacteraeota bacterium]MBC5802046.1 endonuclease [Candidatus Eremiobacteraeota bacterium]
MRNGSHVELLDSVGASSFEDALAPLLLAWRAEPRVEPSALALALEAALKAREAAASSVELVWTGPASDAATTLNTTAVLFRIIRRSEKRLLLMSYSAFPIPGLVDELQAACDRGVSVRLVLESVFESGNRLTIDAAAPFALVRGRAAFYTWPHALRQPGAVMHVKCAVADSRTALVTSANLTERGVDANFELGTYFEDSPLPQQIERHIDALAARDVLIAM